jgi:hypothetical protein
MSIRINASQITTRIPGGSKNKFLNGDSIHSNIQKHINIHKLMPDSVIENMADTGNRFIGYANFRLL